MAAGRKSGRRTEVQRALAVIHAALRHDQSDVIVLFIGAELADFVNDRSQ